MTVTEGDHVSLYLMQNGTSFISQNLIRVYKTHEHLYNYHQFFLVLFRDVAVLIFPSQIRLIPLCPHPVKPFALLTRACASPCVRLIASLFALQRACASLAVL